MWSTLQGFRKTDTDRWEFANDGFIRGQKHLLKNICRRKHSQSSDQKKVMQHDNSVESGKENKTSGLWEEVESLKTDKDALMQELALLSKHLETAENKLLVLRERLQGMEKSQQQMLSFLVMAMQNPGILAQILHPKEQNNWHATEVGKNMIEHSTEVVEAVPDGSIIRYQPVEDETSQVLNSPVPDPEIPQPESDLFPNSFKDLFLNIDFAKMFTDEKLFSSENHGQLVLPDISDDGSWEQLFSGAEFYREEQKDSDMETDSEMCENQLENVQAFEDLIKQMEKADDTTKKFIVPHIDGSKKSHNMERLTEQMGLLAAEARQKD